MATLRNTWQRTFRKALAFLKAHPHPIAQMTAKLIENKTVEIKSLYHMDQSDYARLINETNRSIDDKISTSFPPTASSVNRLQTKWNGRIYGNRLYISSELTDPKDFARIIIHEANHYINHSNENYRTNDQRFEEECRARIAEAMVFRPLYTRTRSFLKDIAQNVTASGRITMPPTLKMPKGIYTL